MPSSRHPVKSDEVSPDYEGDGIDLKQLFSAIWQTRKLVLACVLIAAVALAGLIAMLRIALPTEQIFQHRIAFTFDGAEKRIYPNATVFSINDLLAPAVLKKVYEDNDLAAQNIKFENFISMVSVYPFAAGFDRVVARYQARLSDRNLTFTERVEIEKDMQKELDARQSHSAQVRLTVRKRIGISKELGQKIVRDIPATWARIGIEQRGILKFVGGFESENLVDETLLNSLDYMLVIDLLRSYLKRLDVYIEKIEDIGGYQTIVDEKSGHTVNSLRRAAMDLSTFKLKELLFVTTKFAFTKTPERTILFFENKLQQLLRAQDLYKNKAASTKSVLEDYIEQNRAVAASSPPNSISTTTIAQYGDAVLDRIVTLTLKGTDQQFRQGLTQTRLTNLNRVSELNEEIALTKEIVAKLTDRKNNPSEDPTSARAQMQKMIKVELPRIAADLNHLWQASGRLQEKLSFKKLSYSGKIYSDALLPSSRAVFENHPVVNKRVIILYLAALFIIAIAASALGLINQTINAKRKIQKK